MWAACIMLRKQGQPPVILKGLDFNKALQASHKRNGSNLEINYFLLLQDLLYTVAFRNYSQMYVYS